MTTSAPLAFVVPVAGVSVTDPPSVLDWVSVTAVPEIGLPPLSLAVMVKVPVGVPLEDNEEGDANKASVVPVICIGYVAVAVPDVAVMVAVRFA
ncbi:MAG: hypothetical protein WCF09_02810 [Gallionella sp.]